MSIELNTTLAAAATQINSTSSQQLPQGNRIASTPLTSTLASAGSESEGGFLSTAWYVVKWPFVKAYEWIKWIICCCPSENPMQVLDDMLQHPRDFARRLEQDPVAVTGKILDAFIADPLACFKTLKDSEKSAETAGRTFSLEVIFKYFESNPEKLMSLLQKLVGNDMQTFAAFQELGAERGDELYIAQFAHKIQANLGRNPDRFLQDLRNTYPIQAGEQAHRQAVQQRARLMEQAFAGLTPIERVAAESCAHENPERFFAHLDALAAKKDSPAALLCESFVNALMGQIVPTAEAIGQQIKGVGEKVARAQAPADFPEELAAELPWVAQFLTTTVPDTLQRGAGSPEFQQWLLDAVNAGKRATANHPPDFAAIFGGLRPIGELGRQNLADFASLAHTPARRECLQAVIGAPEEFGIGIDPKSMLKDLAGAAIPGIAKELASLDLGPLWKLFMEKIGSAAADKAFRDRLEKQLPEIQKIFTVRSE